jgi:hypothetical protein
VRTRRRRGDTSSRRVSRRTSRLWPAPRCSAATRSYCRVPRRAVRRAWWSTWLNGRVTGSCASTTTSTPTCRSTSGLTSQTQTVRRVSFRFGFGFRFGFCFARKARLRKAAVRYSCTPIPWAHTSWKVAEIKYTPARQVFATAGVSPVSLPGPGRTFLDLIPVFAHE